MTHTLTITPPYRDLFQEAGLDHFDRLMHGEIGDQVSQEKGREVRRFELEGPDGPATFYLKRTGPEPPLKLLAPLVRGIRPRSGPLREALMVERLRTAGFHAMEPVAWGESRFCGLPREGFLVVKAVPGDSVADLFDGTNSAERRTLIRQVGCLIGRLHHAGFPHPVRLKDLIRRPDGELVLIDRETSKPWPTGPLHGSRKGLQTIARAARRTLRDGHPIGAGSACAFLKGYLEGAQDYPPSLSPVQIARTFIRCFRAEMRANG